MLKSKEFFTIDNFVLNPSEYFMTKKYWSKLSKAASFRIYNYSHWFLGQIFSEITLAMTT